MEGGLDPSPTYRTARAMPEPDFSCRSVFGRRRRPNTRGPWQYHAPSRIRDQSNVNRDRVSPGRYDLANRQDGGLMIDLMDPDGVTAEWLTEVFAAEGVLRSGSVVSCAAEPLAMSFTGVVPTTGAQL